MKIHSFVARISILPLLLGLALTTEFPSRTSGQSNSEAQAAEARKLWEQALAAKGGRERLLGVKNIHFTSEAEYTTRRGKRNSIKREGLLVLPDKTWVWQDMRPDVFGLRVEMYNYGEKIFYILAPDDPDNAVHHLTFPDKWEESELVTSQLLYLMETQWVKPVPVAVHSGTVNAKAVDIVQTQVFGKRFDFALDRQTHLPIRVSSYDKLITGGEGYTIFNVDLSEYAEVNGIKIARKFTPENGPPYSEETQLNLDYNEELFAKPTSLEAGSQAWLK